MDLAPPQIPASITSAEPIDDLRKERELRALRARVAQLETEKTELTNQVKPSLTTLQSYEEKQHRTSTCGFHLQVIVSLETASVACATCGVELAPLDVLREFARDERQFVNQLNSLRDEHKKLGQEVEKLKTQRSSLRSQVRKKGGDVPDDPGATRPTTKQFYRLHAEYVRVCTELAQLKDARKAGS